MKAQTYPLVWRLPPILFTTGLLMVCPHREGIADEPRPREAVPTVLSFTLIDAEMDLPLFPLLNEQSINLAKLATLNLNVRANLDSGVAGSVVFDVDGSRNIENFSPYAAMGDTEGDYFAWTPAWGRHMITATPYSLPRGKGTAGESLTIDFLVVDDPARPEIMVRNYFDFTSTYRFLLEQGEADRFFFTLETSDGSALPTPAAITIIDDESQRAPAWVAFPSSANQDTGYDFSVNTIGLEPGIYTSTVVFGPVDGFDPGIAKIILEVADGGLPFIQFLPQDFNLVFEQTADGDVAAEYVVMASDGNPNGIAQVLGIDLATGKPAEWLSFSSASNFETPYSFFVSGDMPAGAYSAELIGAAFELISGRYRNARAFLELTLTPAFRTAQFVLIDAQSDQPLFRLHDGGTISPLYRLNIQARTFPEVTGSVRIVVNGWAHIEKYYPYAVFGDTSGDYFEWIPSPGQYHLSATPYSEPNARGQAGESLSITFTVLNSAEADFEVQGTKATRARGLKRH